MQGEQGEQECQEEPRPERAGAEARAAPNSTTKNPSLPEDRGESRMSSYNSEESTEPEDSSDWEEPNSLDQDYYDVASSGSDIDPFTRVLTPAGGILGPPTGKTLAKNKTPITQEIKV